MKTPLKTTPLLDLHRELGGKIVPFAGWSMPIQFAGVMEEHRCVREKVGLFDVSHMGEIEVTGPGSLDYLQYLVTNDVSTLVDGSILYSVMCYENGGVVDDLLVHRHSQDHYFLCVNASNTDKDFEWATGQSNGFDVEVKNISQQTSQLALQGPRALEVLKSLTDEKIETIAYYHFLRGQVGGIDCIISRTGYTGEDGFELYLPAESATALARHLLEAGAPHGIQPIGLGARDTLRLEMGYALYGQEINSDIHPLEARLGWVVKLDKENEFCGKTALVKARAEGIQRRLVGLKMSARGVPRSHYKILKEGVPVGEVTSGTFSPTLNTGIAMGFVPAGQSKSGEKFEIEIRGQGVSAEVVPLPFVPSHVKK
ncbi:MAG: glycine cleavage system aminomethyltransferase GcvT [Candidatus Nitronauta litoralis]|uniref:Aminomethyltransferase n=1 Tax=Candidatus Nitronauta litoralis TaxID=2705533 RepID=A0A7T0G1Q2_9BACT|nr:MAG: glycine cleavage system aminomethyltransferase GcvT [Candidatus Nitronauta litoralis]